MGTSTLLCPTSNATSSSGICSYPLIHYISDENFSPCYRAFNAAIIADMEPSWFSNALSIPYWEDSMCSKIDALAQNQNWHITIHSPRKKGLVANGFTKSYVNSTEASSNIKLTL